MFKTKNGQMEKYIWSIKGDYIIVEYDKKEDPEKWKYALEGNELVFRVTNIAELTLRRK